MQTQCESNEYFVTNNNAHGKKIYAVISHETTPRQIIAMPRNICKYTNYLKAQRISNSRLRENEDLPSDLVETFSERIN